MSTPQCIWPLGAELGEGPMWMAQEERLYFVDIRGQAIHRCAADGSERRSWAAPGPVSFVQPLAGGGFVAGLEHGLHRFDPADGRFTPLLTVEPDRPGNRLNDATVDAQGRLWFGSMDKAETQPSGALYRIGPGGELLAQDRGYVISNGPAQSPDGRTLYHTDTLAKCIYAFDLSAEGELSSKRLLISIERGWPDGTSVNAEGHLWVALFGGARLERYTPEGRLVQTVGLPCDNVTKLAFGGPDLRTAFVTTAWKGSSPSRRAAQPLAGGLFTFALDTPGLPQYAIAQGLQP